MLAVYFFVSAKDLEDYVEVLLPSRQNVDISKLLKRLQMCPATPSTFIGAFELFASTPDFSDPVANLNRTCVVPAEKLTGTTEKSTAGGTYGDGLLSLVVVIAVCRMLLV